jgi:hypothetical protein
MRRYQEGRQRQGLRTVFKLLKEWYGKTEELQWTTLRRLKPQSWFSIFHLAIRGRRFSSDEEVIDTGQNWLKTQPKNFFLTKFKKKKNL